jgi:Tfp pilus assembly protein PilW
VKRRGAAMFEAIAAIAIAAAVLTGVVQLLVLANRQLRISQQHALAAREAGNLMEDLMSRPWTEVTPDSASSVQLSQWCRDSLPDARLRVEVAAEGDADETRRIGIQIDWRNAANQRGQPVRLTAWRHRYEEAPP